MTDAGPSSEACRSADTLRGALEAAPDAGARTELVHVRIAAGGDPLDLAEASLQGVILPLARMRRAELSRADLREADLCGAFLAQSVVSDARFDAASLRGADFSYASGRGAHFGEADLRDALFEEADLRGAKFRFADLSGAALEGSDLSDADLWGARLDGADLTGARLLGAALPEVKACGTDFTRADLRRANLTNTDLRRSCLADADLRDAQVTDAQLDGADLSGAWLQDVDLSRCSLVGCSWNLARLDRTRFEQRQLGAMTGEERDRKWDAAAGAYLALERNFANLGAVEASSWAYGRRRRMQKRVAGQGAAVAWRERRWAAAARSGASYAGDTLVEWSCGYGESIGRVFATLFVSFGAFVALYALTGAVTRSSGGAPVVTRRFIDLAVFSMEAMTNTQASSADLRPSDTLSLFLTGAQTLVSIFLTGLLGFIAGNRIRR